MIALLILSLFAAKLTLEVDAQTSKPRPDPPPTAKVVRGGDNPIWIDVPDCSGSRKAITFYRGKYREHREKMLLSGPVPRVWYKDCKVVNRRAGEWREKAGDARETLAAWHEHHFGWERWLPRGWVNIGSCETGYGGAPNWRHNNSSFEGAFGFAKSSWDSYVDEAPKADGPYPASAADATPRQQYNVALVIYGHFGLSGWGCRGAFNTWG